MVDETTPEAQESTQVVDIAYPTISTDLFEQALQFTPEDIQKRGFPEGTTPAQVLATDVAFVLKRKNPGLFKKNEDPYRSIALGTSQLTPEKDRNRQITDEEILRRYLRNPDNQPMREGSIARGFGKQIAPSMGGLGGFYGGVKAGFALQQAIPPVNPFFIGAKFLIPVATGIAGQIAGEESVEALRDYFLGAPDLVDPRTAGRERVGETAAIATSFAPLPFLTTKKALEFGALKYVDELEQKKMEKLEKVLSVGPLTKEAGEAAFREARRKAPRSTRLIKAAETAIPRMGVEAAKNPFKTAVREGSFVVGATGGRYLSEEYLDGQYALPAEILGGISSGLVLPAVVGAPYYGVKYWPDIKAGVGKVITALKPESMGGKPLSTLFKREGDAKAFVDVVNIFEERLIQAGEDPQKIAQIIDEFVEQPEFKNFTSGTLTQSPTLLRIEHDMATLFPDLKAQGQDGVRKAIDNYKNLLVAFAMVGDSSAMRQIEMAFQETIETAFIQQMDAQVKRVIEAAERVGSGETSEAVGRALQTNLENALTAARSKERLLYSRIPDAEINVFRDEPGADGELGAIREIPNVFDWINRLPESRTSLAALPKQLQTQVNYIKEILQDAGIDTSQLGKRGTAARTTAESRQRENIEARITRLSQARQALLDKMSERTKLGMRNLLDLTSNGRQFSALSPEEKLQALRRDLNIIDDLREATRGRRKFDDDEFRMAELEEIRKLILNRQSAARAEVDLSQVGGQIVARNEDEVRADEIIDLRALVDELRQTGEPISISSRKLSEMRTNGLTASRELRAIDNYNSARLSDLFSDAVNQDLTGALDEIAGEGTQAALSAARAFSRALNDVFTRAGAPSAILGTRATGAERIPAEEAVKTLFTGRSDRVYRNAKEIAKVGQFLRDQVEPDVELLDDLSEFINVGSIVNDVPDIMERALRNIRSVALQPRGTGNPDDLALNVQELQKWLNDPNNQQLMALFPKQFEDDLRQAGSAYDLLMASRNNQKEALKEAKSRLAFKGLVERGDETPSATIAGALSSKRPLFELNQIWDTITKSDVPTATKQEASESLKAGIFDWAINTSSNQNGDLNARRMFDSLFTPTSRGSQVTPAEWMVSKNILTKKDVDTIQQYLAEMTNIESLLTKEGLDELLKSESGPLRDLTLRIIGAKLGTTASGLIGGSEASLIAAGAGSRALRALFVSNSGINNMKAFKALLADPKMLSRMLKTPRDKRQAKNMFQMFKDWMLSKGLVAGRRLYTIDETTDQDEDSGIPKLDPMARSRNFPSTTDFGGAVQDMLGRPEQTTAVEAPKDGFPEEELALAESAVGSPRQVELDLLKEKVAQRPTNLSSPEPRDIPLDTRRDFERMEGQLAGVGRVPAQQLGALTIDQQLDAPLSVKNNNPGNLRMAGQPGAKEGIEGFASFSTPGQGLNALTRQIVLDTQTRGLTLGEFITKYAPPSENDTLGYIRFMEQKTGLDRDRKVPDFLVRDVARAIVEFEGGRLALRYFFGDEMRAEATPPPVAQAPTPTPPPASPPVAARATPQSIQRAARVLGPQDDIGMLASEMMMRDRPA